jgi:hypothetical protein
MPRKRRTPFRRSHGLSLNLLIDRLPFHQWVDRTRQPPREHWSIRLPVLISAPGLDAPPAGATIQEWVFDIGFTAQAFAWRWHLENAGIDLELWDVPSNSSVRSSIDNRKEPVRICQVDVWLPEFPTRNDGRIERLDLEVMYRDISNRPDPQLNRPLLGLRSFMSVGVKAEIDFLAKTTSMWWRLG